ncbi:MAG TPA: hypothetical protein VGM39_09745 [Kofleriaceae bacterium]|jgi:hypothetical protein
MALDLIAELEQVATAFDLEGIEYALCGGLALGVLGHPRNTKDIDLLIRPDRATDALRVAKGLGFDIPARKIIFGLRAGTPREVQRVSKMDPETNNLLPLDLMLVCPDYEPVWAGRLVFDLPGFKLTVVSRDGLATMKRIAGRPQDLADLATLEGHIDDDAIEE